MALAVGQASRYSSLLSIWNPTNENVAHVFGRAVLSVVWDFAEANLLHGPLRFTVPVEWVASALASLPAAVGGAEAGIADATAATSYRDHILVSTDPPYYDNVPYAGLSNFFYPTLRASLSGVLPSLFSTLRVPLDAELVVDPYTYGGAAEAERHFRLGLSSALKLMQQSASADSGVASDAASRVPKVARSTAADGPARPVPCHRVSV